MVIAMLDNGLYIAEHGSISGINKWGIQVGVFHGTDQVGKYF
jgi:hypothetical protein